jgi:predicted oxidoreductase (fatty acid repression mutant protein)
LPKNKDEYDKMVHYTGIIKELQDDFGLRISSFPHIGKSALAFHSLRAWQITQKNKSNSGSNNNEYNPSD